MTSAKTLIQRAIGSSESAKMTSRQTHTLMNTLRSEGVKLSMRTGFSLSNHSHFVLGDTAYQICNQRLYVTGRNPS